MTGQGVRKYLQELIERLDLSEKAAALRRTVAVATVPVAASFTVACYAAGWDEFYPSNEDEVCYNGVDDNYDGLADCDDPTCALTEACLGCDDGLDNDGDGLADCSDPACLRIAPCSDELCGDLVDNDGDGRVDCDDADCGESESCLTGYDELTGAMIGGCSDGLDNDGNGPADCEDPSCQLGELCQGSMACYDGMDNDGDGLVDCMDPDCGRDPICD